MLGGDLFADVLDGGDGLAGGVVDGLTAGIDAGEITGVRDGLGPGEKVGGLVCVEAAAFLLVEKDDGASREVFALRCGDRCCGVLFSQGGGAVPPRLARAISASVLPLARTRKPKPLRRRTSRLPCQLFWRSPGGLVSQYPAKAKCRRSAGRRRRPDSRCCQSRSGFVRCRCVVAGAGECLLCAGGDCEEKKSGEGGRESRIGKFRVSRI